jgi:hypothetical protein
MVCQYLKHLNVGHGFGTPLKLTNVEFLHFFKSLQNLTFTDIVLYDMHGLSCVSSLSSLETLTLQRVQYGSEYGLYEGYSGGNILFISSLKKLKRLKLEFVLGFGSEISDLCSCTNLSALSIMSCFEIGNISSLNGLVHLEEICIVDAMQLTGSLEVLSTFTKLRVCILTHLKLLSGNISAFSSLSTIEEIKLAHCPSLTGDIASLSCLAKVKKLVVFNCPQIEGRTSSLINFDFRHSHKTHNFGFRSCYFFRSANIIIDHSITN